MARTPKARALGAALRQAREGKGMFLREIGAAINRDIGVLSRWETGERTPKPEQVAQILTTLGINGEDYEQIMTLAYGTDESQWVATTLPEQRQQMAAYVDWEQNATRIVEVAPLLIPGLLQTNDYIRAIMTAGGVPQGEIASRVTTRIGRREAITKHRPANLLVLLGQGALNQEIGGQEAMVEQLQHLLEMAARPNIELRIVPDRCGWHPGLEGAFALIESKHATKNKATATSIVFMETRRSVLMLHEDYDVDAYRQAIDKIMKVSLTPVASTKFIKGFLNRMEKSSVN
ncbi:helix-turn-helix domain-containing protein [Actinokineospora iranica]|uniref:Helix-turn-helix domain-containing protein n=1 Tax=Actinokineospora iranica TaxID=1271860 RepID=A0A1G6PZS5_9PSEU|nr:helix-turn-helix transcriptional regulator [Actinokineospora iranica]SDC85613.1 Helix-turn-helix domain-containing protein [Actinokineospora iranica]